MKERLRVTLLYGGRGYESEVSLRGKAHVLPYLEEKYCVLQTFIDKCGRWICDGEQVFPTEGGFIDQRGRRLAVDCAIPLLHGDFGEDGVVQGALENAKIPYIGCDTRASALCRDKFVVKQVAESLSIPTLPCLLLLRREGIDYSARLCEERLGYPIFIKPCLLGSSIGASAARNKEELRFALENAFSLCERLIAEPCLDDKRELECGYFSAGGREIYSWPGEILIEGSYGYEEKYLSDTRLAARAEIPSKIACKIRDYSRALTRALGLRDISRIVYFLSRGEIYFNEINTTPGFTSGSLYHKMLSAAGVPLDGLFELLISNAVARG